MCGRRCEGDRQRDMYRYALGYLTLFKCRKTVRVHQANLLHHKSEGKSFCFGTWLALQYDRIPAVLHN